MNDETRSGVIQTPQTLDLVNLDAALQSEHLVIVRRRIFRQLIESLIYERVLEPETESSGEQLTFRIHGQDTLCQPVVYLCHGRRRFSFDRMRLCPEPVMRIANNKRAEAGSLSSFLWEVLSPLGVDTERLVQFSAELEQTLLKDILAQYQRRREGQLLRNCTYDEIESGLPDGHPYHPSYKSRIGFDYIDNLRFGPEFRPSLRPLWLAAHREWTSSAVSCRIDPLAFMQREIGAALYAEFIREIRFRGYDPDDYLLLPVHPWQWRERVVASLSSDLADGRLILLGIAADAYHPQQSIRTLANATAPEKASLKLSLSIVNTSTSRILAPHTVQNAPLISDWLQEIAQRDPILHAELRPIFLEEVVGVAYNRPQPDFLQPTTYGVLSCIWRQSLSTFLSSDEGAVPFTALCHLDVDGHPFIEPWIRKDGLEQWVHRLLEVSILPVIHLLYAHGIALEAHAQNVILIHRQGVPRRLALKDFHDGVRFAPAFLAAPHQRPILFASPPLHLQVNRNSYIEADSLEDVRDFVHDAFFFINLSELALFLSDHFGLEERHFWHLAHTVITDYQRRFPHLHKRFALFDLFALTVQVEQLTKRRLYPDTEVRVHRVRNALALLGAGNM